ncbi:hypothetical protein [Azospirillum endophyticum]
MKDRDERPSSQLLRHGSTRIGGIVAQIILKQFVIFPGNFRNSVLSDERP